jgi:radical SAM protein with 4Fe4S-binding SPASM domain
MSEHFGHINEVSLMEVLIKKDFSVLWGITKDDILICKDCEFRYMCTDCRAHIQDKNNVTSKPINCEYDPYTALWRK